MHLARFLLRRQRSAISVIFANDSLIESEKERNLCTKFFAGYFFNEFTAGYAKRILHFNRYLQEVTGREDIALQNPHVSFDTHAYLCHERLRSKLSDVLISDPVRQVFLFIETKYLTNWSYAADVAKAQERLDKVFDASKKPHLANAKAQYFILTSKRKEEAAGRPVNPWAATAPAEAAVPAVGESAESLEAATEPTTPVEAPASIKPAPPSFTNLLYWEDLAQMCDRSEVRQYMEARLKLCISSSRNQHKSGYFLPGA